MSSKKLGNRPVVAQRDDEDVQALVGRIIVTRARWETIVDVTNDASIYRIFNSASRDNGNAKNSLMLQVDEPPRNIRLYPGASLDIQAKKIRVRAGDEGSVETAEGRYTLMTW
jgi:hypothetical protein